MTRWIVSTNHKDVGILFFLLACLVGGISVLLSIYVRLELAAPGPQYLCAEGFRLVTTTVPCTPNSPLLRAMLTAPWLWLLPFALVPALLGLGSHALPRLIAAPDLALPWLNKLTFWFCLAALLIGLTALMAPGVWMSAKPDEAGGLVLYPPISSTVAGDGATDLALLAMRLFQAASLLGAGHLVVTFLACRSPGQVIGKVSPLAWLIVLAACFALAWLPWLLGGIVMGLTDPGFGTSFFAP